MPDTEIIEPLLTTAEVARIMRRSPRTVHRWRVQQAIPHVRTPGGRVFFRTETIRELLMVWERA